MVIVLSEQRGEGTEGPGFLELMFLLGIALVLANRKVFQSTDFTEIL